MPLHPDRSHVLYRRGSSATWFFPALVGALLALPAAAQSPERGADAAHETLRSEPAAGDAALEAEPGLLVTGGSVRAVPIEALPDVPRMPIGRVAREGAEGDVLVAPASGNPHFLGFAAGVYAPPAGVRLDPELARAAEALEVAPRPHADTYAFVMFEKRIREDRVEALEALGVRVLDYHPNNCLRVAVPVDALDEVAALEFVRWVGPARPWQKLHPALAGVLAEGNDGPLELLVSVFESDLGPDSVRVPLGIAQLLSPTGIEETPAELASPHGSWRSNGWQQAALEAAGMEIDQFRPRSVSFRGRIPRERLEALTALDFVQFVEPWIAPTQAHDESMPMIQADLTRSSWSGGTTSSVVVGEVDSGIDTTHSGLNHIWGWGWDLTTGGTSAWVDSNGHGSHVAGTIFGKADADRSLDGVAPGLGSTQSLRVYNVKVFGPSGTWSGGSTLADVLDHFETPLTDPNGNTTPIPHVVNHSWGLSGTNWIGTEADCRELDNSIWTYNQLHVFASGNEGPAASRIRQQAASKNVLTVGNVLDYHLPAEGYPGTIYSRSSIGPTGDLRWKPNVAAPGRWIDSVNAGTGTGYVQFWGTSMAAPHVTGLAAQLMDHFDFLRYRPAALGAVIMASALTKNGVTLAAPSTSSSHHYNVYGTGRVDAFRAHNLAGQAMYFWNFGMSSSSSHVELDLVIPENATRVAFVMLYHERAASAGASSALVNDIDMYLDREPFAAGGNTGDYWSHQSTRDNAEVRILNNPGAGNWRIKIYPENVTSSFLTPVRVGVAAVVTLQNTQPAATLTTSVDKTYVKPNEVVRMTATVANPSYVATMVHLASNLGSGGVLVGAETTLKDGPIADLMNNPDEGTRVTLGNIRSGHNRSVRWDGRWSTEGNKTWAVNMTSENAGNPSSSKPVVVDGTAPQGPTGINAPGHPAGFSRCNTQVLVNWTAATDNLSGIQGYRVQFDNSPSTNLPQTQNLGAVTSYSQTLPPSPNPYYFHVRAVDRSGNWGTTQHYGPITIVPGGAYSYCTSAPNSAGPGATISSNGNVSLSANGLQLVSSGLPLGQPSLYFAGTSAVSIPFGNGVRCAGGFVVRLGIVNTGAGTNVFNVNLGAGSPFGTLFPGQARYFQNWYRDPLAGGAGYNLTNGLHVLFCE